MPQNIYKTSNEILEISSIIESDSAATGLEKRTLYSSQQLLELRQYDPSIRGILRRNDLLDWSIDPDDETQIADVIASNHHLHRLALVSRYGIQIDRQEIFNKQQKNVPSIILSLILIWGLPIIMKLQAMKSLDRPGNLKFSVSGRQIPYSRKSGVYLFVCTPQSASRQT